MPANTGTSETLADYRTFTLWADVDWGKVYQLAEEQSVIGLVSAGL